MVSDLVELDSHISDGGSDMVGDGGPKGPANAPGHWLNEPVAALMLIAAFLTSGVASSHAAATVFAVAGHCELPYCLWGSERQHKVADEFKHWHPEGGALLMLAK